MTKETEKEKRELNKPIIETIINTTALTMTGFAVQQIITNNQNIVYAYLALFIGMGLEFIKYWGRKREFW